MTRFALPRILYMSRRAANLVDEIAELRRSDSEITRDVTADWHAENRQLLLDELHAAALVDDAERADQ
ncbi:hypothetical protein [Amycolatopsis sp. NPDC051128]|uniref:hypothetical protein n=1 Tax=Amycolatopsis sp. NPDC051128 TaxID=3155412 RepID=UPI003426B386